MSDFYYTAGHSQCPGIFFGSIRVRDLQGTEIAFKLFLHCGFLGRLGKANFHDDLSVAEAVGVADLTDEVQYPFLSWKFCVDGYIPNIDKLFWIDRLNINGGERIKLCKRDWSSDVCSSDLSFLPLQSIQKGACPMPENAGPR